jgi:hypothetical protein
MNSLSNEAIGRADQLEYNVNYRKNPCLIKQNMARTEMETTVKDPRTVRTPGRTEG